MGKHLFVSDGNVKPRTGEKLAGYTINFGGQKAYIRTTYSGIMAVLRVLDQFKKGAK